MASPLVEGPDGRLETRRAPIDHYTGTLYKALGVPDWSSAERRWARTHLLIHDGDAGIVSAGSWDPVDLALPGPPVEEGASRPSRDHPVDGLLIDARSGEYVRRIRPPAHAFALRVVSEGADGRRLAISHWNKLHKGVLAAALVRDRPRIRRVHDLLAWASGAAIRLERVGDRQLDLVV